MRRLARDRLITLGFVVFSFALALGQRPGWGTTDTKIDLHVDPGRFLSEVASVWTATGDLGEVHSSQYVGYLWPMGPFYAALHGVGLSAWVTERLWLGAIFALSAWGVLRLMDVLVGRPRGVAHVVAAAFYVLNPYMSVFTGRSTSALVGLLALPWLLVVVLHGARATAVGLRWASWWWPAAFALIVTSLGAGINGAVVGWMLVGTLVLLAYEPLIGTVRWRDSGAFLLRAGVLSVLASLWWIVPLMLYGRYGVDFLQFTEQPRAIWHTNAAPEALRLMGYWTSYASLGFYGRQSALFSEAGTMLFNPFVVGSSLLLPALGIAGFIWTRRQRYAPFFLLILLVGVAIEVAGFPSGTPVRHGMDWVYREFEVVRFMRTTQKAAPLVAIGSAGLLGLAAQFGWTRLRALRPGRLRPLALAAAPLALVALIALSALPLVRGTAPDENVTWKRIPSAWKDAGTDLDRTLPANSRALVLPGEIFAFYRWGGTVDNILPRLTDRPVAVRYETPYSDPHASDLLITVDGLVQQRRLVPGQLDPLLRLMGVRAVVSGSDADPTLSGALEPAAAAAELEGQGLTRPSRSFGPRAPVAAAHGDIGPGAVLPQVRRYDVQPGRGIVSVAPRTPAAIVDGSAQGLADLAAFGALPQRRPILYAGDLTKAQLRDEAASGAEVVVTDSNRRRQFLATHTQQNLGRTLAATELFGKESALIDPFPERGPDAQTVAALQGASYLRAPEGGGPLTFPERAPIQAFDGDPTTLWAAARYLRPSTRWLEVGFSKPRDVDHVDLMPVHDWRGIEREVDINGVRAPLQAGWNRVPVHLKDVTRLRIRLTKVDQPDSDLRGSGGFREIRIPGVHLRQPYRPPVLTAQALAGRDLSKVALSYVFERTMGDRPHQRDRYTDSPLVEHMSNRQDVEKQIDRLVFAPEARSYRVEAWAQPSVDTRDPVLDRMAGVATSSSFDSSSRFQNQPRYRASSAFDGSAGSDWIGVWARPSVPLPWISWETRRSLEIDHLRLSRSSLPIRHPTVVRLSWSGGSTPALPVGPGGEVRLPEPVRARSFRLTVLRARFAGDADAADRTTRAVGVAEVVVPGLEPVRVPRTGPVRAGCGSARIKVGGSTVPLRAGGTVEQFDVGVPLRARSCGGEVRMGGGTQSVRSLESPLTLDLLRLASAAPTALPAASGGGSVTDPGRLRADSIDGARVALDGPSWLVLGESFSTGWEATCDGRSLGEPTPINGYANGWRAPAECHDVSFEFTPQRTARAAYIAAAVVCLLLAIFLVVAALGGRHLAPAASLDRLLPDVTPRPMPLPRAAAIALAITVPLCLLFALRTSLLTFPLFTIVLWRGVRSEPLTAVAAAALGIAVPVMYAVISPRNRGGYNFDYSLELMRAHWVGVAGVLFLIAACWRALSSARGQADGPPISPTKTARAEYSRKS
jgi:hypothetical protein